MTDKPVWLRLPNEKQRAYNAFTAYRDLGPKRTLQAAYKEFVENPDAKQPSSEYYRWRTIHNWEARCEAYDMHIEQERHTAMIEGMKLEEFKRGEALAGGYRELSETGRKAREFLDGYIQQMLDGEVETNPTQAVALFGKLINLQQAMWDVQKYQDKAKAGDASGQEKDHKHFDEALKELLGSEETPPGGAGPAA